MISDLINVLRSYCVKYVIISEAILKTDIKTLLEREEFNVVTFIDSRSAGYAATGICAEQKKPVALITENDNDSRNCYAALTEAYYRKLPIIFITINNGFELNYRAELRDTVVTTVVIDETISYNAEIIKQSIDKSLPVHIILRKNKEKKAVQSYIDGDISPIMNSDNYIYLGNSFAISDASRVRRNIAGGYDGVISNVMGASLSGVYKKYIGVSDDIEMIHDLNALGNRHLNNLISFVIYYRNNRNKDIIAAYAQDFGFEIYEGKENIIQLLNTRKTIVFVEGK